ncbi:MAG: hypothetical protein OSB21_00075 [Myxococcota bacterium]|nr:hypothetical protein [Myxococcota bacterium]
MSGLFILSLALLVDGHHALPAQPGEVACWQAEGALRTHLLSGRRPQRRRALILLERCSFTLDWARLRADNDPEMALVAWRYSLQNAVVDDPRWAQALQQLPKAQGRSVLRLHNKRRRANLAPGLPIEDVR